MTRQRIAAGMTIKDGARPVDEGSTAAESGLMIQCAREWRAELEPQRPNTHRANRMPLTPLPHVASANGQNYEPISVPSAVAAIKDQLQRAKIPLEFPKELGRPDPEVPIGVLTDLVFDRGIIAFIHWAAGAENYLTAWGVNNVRPMLVFKIDDKGVAVALAPPEQQPQTRLSK